MMGTQKQPGLLPRVIDFLFSCIDQSENVEYLLKCSYLEIYNEHIIDLLNPSLGNLQLREDLKKGVYVEQLSEEVCNNVQESLEVLQKGSLNRHISSTQMNIESSRSHSVFTIQLESRRQYQTQVINHRFSRFHFVDLAGSERQKQSQVQGDRLREGCNINRSLHILGNVINSLVEDNQSYVHYRDSKLTFLLKDSLGGNSRTHLIANIQQSQQFYQETLSTLMFSKRVKQVKNKARINEDESGNLESLKNEIKRLKQELAKSVTQVWESPKKVEFANEQCTITLQLVLQSLELESLTINDQRYIKLEEILKCYLEQSTESETALCLEIEKYLSGIKQLKEGFQLGQQLEQQLKFVIKLQNEQIAKLKQNQSAEDIQQQIQQQLSYALQCQGLVMKTFHENLVLREQQGCTQAVSKAQIQVDSNITLLKDIIETVQNSLNERRQFQQQLDQQFNSQYVTLEKFKQLESESEYKEQLLSEQTLKLVQCEQEIKQKFVQRLSENGITFDENDQIQDTRDAQIGDLNNRISNLNSELTSQSQELENILNSSEITINQLKTEHQIQLQQQQEQSQIIQNSYIEKIKQLELDNNKLYSSVQEVQISLTLEQKKNNQLSEQLQLNELKLQSLKTGNDSNTQDFLNKLSEYESIIQKAKSDISQLESIIKLKDQTIASILQDNNELKNNIFTLNSELQMTLTQLQFLQQKFQNSEEEYSNKIAHLENENNSLNQRNCQISKMNAEIESQNTFLEEELQKFQDLLIQSQNEFQDNQDATEKQLKETLQTMNTQYQAEISKYQAEISAFLANQKEIELQKQQLNIEVIIKQIQILEQKNLKDQEIEQLTNQLNEQINKYEDSQKCIQEIQQEQEASLELLQKQLESKQAVIQETSDHYNQVHELYIALQTRMEQKDSTNAELKKEISQLKLINEGLQQKLIAVECEYQQSRATLEIQQQGKLQDMTQKLQNKMKTIESMTIEKNALNEKFRDLECELNKQKLMNSNIELQMGEQQKLVQALQTQALGLKKQLQDEKDQLALMQSEFDSQNQLFEKNVQLWKEEIENLESENATLKYQVNEKQKEVNKIETALCQLQNTITQRDLQIDELESQQEGQKCQEIELLSKENTQLKKQISQISQKVECQLEELQNLRNDYDQKSQQAEESKQHVKKLTKQLDSEIKQYATHMKKFDDQHKKEIQEVVDQLDILQKQLRMKEQTIEQLNKQLNGMQSAFETKDDLTQQSQKEIQQLKDKLKSDQNKFTKIIQGLENTNNILKNQFDESTHLNQENVLKLQSGQKQQEIINIQFNELQEKYNSLKDQMLRFESQMKQESQIREQYSHIADKVTKENNELKQKLDKKQQVQSQLNQIITQLEQALLQNEDTLKNVHDRAKDFCKQQEKEINDIKDQYLKLEAEHNAILSQNQEREDENEQIKDQKDQAVLQMQAVEDELMRTKRELSEQHEKLTKANNERSMLYKQIEEMQRDIAQLGGHNNPSQKIRYLNTIKQENSCLKQEKLYLSEQLQKEIEEKNKLLEKKKQTEQENQSNIKLDMQKFVIENQRLNNEMSKLNQILNLSGIKNRYSTIKGSDGDKIIQSVQLLIQELIDCKQEIQLRNKEQEGKNLKYQTMEKDLLVMKQKFYAVQNTHQQVKAQSPGVQPDVLRDNNRITINSGSVQRQSKPKGQQTFQFQ